ncbi:MULTISPECIES: response regulator [Vibrio]|jgi:DNA-binding NarL/FixJ family response regulator|uniref:response regulator n=1 Tax=Vibrio TaxID=662 RepID=UPI000E676919|nr:response regulator transcription factor [Vibrio sp. PID23_8]RIZ54157.1 LuxR family transcriptional regulator [Vibrio sp. PID23_8]
MKNNSTVVLVDDHELVRAGIRTLLGAIESIEVVGECGEGLDALPILKQLTPDLVVLDISLKGLNGIELVSLIRKQNTNIKILMLSMHNNVEYVAKCLRNGAQGYLLKDSAVDELEPAVMNVLSGDSYISREVDESMLDKLLLDENTPTSLLELLTSRQRQILQLIAEGYSTKQIADSLHVSVKTVETHRTHIMKRLNIFDIAGLVRFAMEKRLIQ